MSRATADHRLANQFDESLSLIIFVLGVCLLSFRYLISFICSNRCFKFPLPIYMSQKVIWFYYFSTNPQNNEKYPKFTCQIYTQFINWCNTASSIFDTNFDFFSKILKNFKIYEIFETNSKFVSKMSHVVLNQFINCVHILVVFARDGFLGTERCQIQ